MIGPEVKARLKQITDQKRVLFWQEKSLIRDCPTVLTKLLMSKLNFT